MIGAFMTDEEAKPKTHHVVTLRMPEGLYKRLAALAAKDRRSLNAEALVILDEAMAEREDDARR